MSEKLGNLVLKIREGDTLILSDSETNNIYGISVSRYRRQFKVCLHNLPKAISVARQKAIDLEKGDPAQ